MDLSLLRRGVARRLLAGRAVGILGHGRATLGQRTRRALRN
jgi:hypothetical protein